MLESTSVVQEILRLALQHSRANPNTIVHHALMLLAVNRMIERSWSICTEDGRRIGLPVVEDPESPWHWAIPTTPVMGTQLDQIFIQKFLTPLREKLLRELQGRMKEARKRDWFETFLVTFILCTNTELLLRHSRKNAKRYGAKHRYNDLELAKEYFHGTNIILAHFNHLHNGTSPLRLESSGSDLKRATGLQEHQADILEKVKKQVRAQEDQLVELRKGHHYETELFWTHQLFFQKWKPEERHIIDEL